MRAPTPSEPKSTFPTYQVPQVSAMRGSAPPVQVARAAWEDRAGPPSEPYCALNGVPSVIYGSSCRDSLKQPPGNSNLKMQSVTDNCLLNSVTVPNKQRKDLSTVAHNNRSKLECKFGALLHGQDIPNQKSDDLEELHLNVKNLTENNHDKSIAFPTVSKSHNNDYSLQRLIELSRWTRELERRGIPLPVLRLCGGGESSLSTGTSGWGTPPSQQASNNNGKLYIYLKSNIIINSS